MTHPRVIGIAQSCAVGLGLLFAPWQAATAADVLAGADLYKRHCALCHGDNGRPVMPTAPDFSRPPALLKPDLTLAASIRAGRGAMPGYDGQLREREILDIVAHLRTLR